MNVPHAKLCCSHCVEWSAVQNESLCIMTHCIEWLTVHNDSLCEMTHCVERLIEAGKALAPGGGVCGGVVGVAPKQLDAQDHEDEDEQEKQQHEVPQCHHTLHGFMQHSD